MAVSNLNHSMDAAYNVTINRFLVFSFTVINNQKFWVAF